MGWSNSTFQLLIITASPSGFSGLFVYSPSPGPSNLVASVASTAGTDPYGNPYQTGITAYQSGFIGTYAQLNNGQVALKSTGSSAIATLGVRGIAPFLGWLGFSGANGYVFDKPIVAEGNVFAQNPSSPFGQEIWHTVSAGSLAAGYAIGSTPIRYRLEPDNTVRLAGVVNLTAAQTAPQNIFQVAPAYIPAQNQFVVCANQLSGAVATQTIIEIATTGFVIEQVNGVNGNTISLDNITYPLD